MEKTLDKKTILVLEDEAEILQLIKENLKGYGARVITTNTIKQGIQLEKQEEIDFIVLDSKLKDGTGFEFLEKINAREKGIYSILITGSLDISEKQCKDLGIANLIKKPFSIQDVGHFLLGIHPELHSSEAMIHEKTFSFRSVKIIIKMDNKEMENLEIIHYSPEILILDSPISLEIGKNLLFHFEFIENEEGISFEFSGEVMTVEKEENIFTIEIVPNKKATKDIEEFTELTLKRQKLLTEFLNKSRGF